MILLLEQNGNAKQLGQAGKKNIKENFSMGRHIDKLQGAIENCKNEM